MTRDRIGEISMITEQIVSEVRITVEQMLNSKTKTCVQCIHWVNGPMTAPIEHCGLAEQRPPAHIIAYGCEKYEDEIPF